MKFIIPTLLAAIVSLTPLGAGMAMAAGDCSAAAARVVAETGGTLLSASPSNEGGRTVCKITVLVPGNGSERPKKRTVSVSL